MSSRPHLQDWFALAALMAVWGSSFMLTQVALDSLTPVLVVFTRVAVGSVVVGLLWRLAFRHASFSALPWTDLALFALLGNVVPFSLIAWGQQHIDSGTTAILLAVVPLIVATLAHFFLRDERLTLARVAGLLVGFVGVIWVVGPAHGAKLAAGGMAVAGKLAIVAAAASYAINVVLVRLRARAEPVACATGTLILSSAVTLPLALVDAPALKSEVTAASVLAVLLLGALSTALGSVLYFRVIRRVGASFLSTINYLIPVWAVLLGVAVLGDFPGPRALVGLVLVLTGVAISQTTSTPRGRPARRALRTRFDPLLGRSRVAAWGQRPSPVTRTMRPAARRARGRGYSLDNY